MEASELRIGNIIQSDVIGPEPVMVASINEMGITSQADRRAENRLAAMVFLYAQLNGEPLTAGWLLNLGFTIREGKYSRGGALVLSQIPEAGWDLVKEETGLAAVHLKTLRYVHELQNTWYMLEEEELSVQKKRV